MKALSISSICPEAFNVLAINQACNFDEALELYRKAVQLGPQAVEESLLKKESNRSKKAAWACPAMRPWFRAQYGLALTLRKLRRYDEALDEWDKLLRMDDGWFGSTSFINVMALYPECMYRWGVRGAHGHVF